MKCLSNFIAYTKSIYNKYSQVPLNGNRCLIPIKEYIQQDFIYNYMSMNILSNELKLKIDKII